MFETNLINKEKNNDYGKCPVCGGKVEVSEMKAPHRVNLIVSCQKCKKEEMFLGVYKREE